MQIIPCAYILSYSHLVAFPLTNQHTANRIKSQTLYKYTVNVML